MAAFRLRVTAGLIAGLVSTSAFAPDFSVLLGSATELQQQIAREAASHARAAQAFGASLSAADRRALQGACTALVANPDDASAQRTLQEFLSRYKDNTPEAVMRFCLDPSITFLQEQVLVNSASLERLAAAGDASQERGAELESAVRQHQQTFTSISNVMKTRHDTAKNSISNVR